MEVGDLFFSTSSIRASKNRITLQNFLSTGVPLICFHVWSDRLFFPHGKRKQRQAFYSPELGNTPQHSLRNSCSYQGLPELQYFSILYSMQGCESAVSRYTNLMTRLSTSVCLTSDHFLLTQDLPVMAVLSLTEPQWLLIFTDLCTTLTEEGILVSVTSELLLFVSAVYCASCADFWRYMKVNIDLLIVYFNSWHGSFIASLRQDCTDTTELYREMLHKESHNIYSFFMGLFMQ